MPPISMAIRFLILLFLIYTATASASLMAYQVMEEYGFPVGLLPKGVLGYKLDNSTGKFSVYLNGSCTFSIESYELKYKSTITGAIAKDKITNLSGIKVKLLILWLSIVSVTHEDEELDFSVGIASADFTVSSFVASPTCGCGFNCVSDQKGIRKINKSYSLLSSS